jgi:thymidylate synthase
MKTYLDALQHVLTHGEARDDRTGVGTIGTFGLQMRYDLRQGFPAVTTKKLAFRSCAAELLWFLEGSNDERRLAEITHGTREGVATIWTLNSLAPYWRPQAKFTGDVGRIYGVQWRDFGGVDQIAELIQGIKQDPLSRRHILTAWNPPEIDDMALPPCHVMAQFYVTRDWRLSCQMYQRSGDLPLGIPFNVASYSLLTHMIAQVCDLGVGEFIHCIGDAHIYQNQIEGVKEQLTRDPLPLPKLWLNPEIKDIEKFTLDDIKLVNYQHHPTISFPFST